MCAHHHDCCILFYTGLVINHFGNKSHCPAGKLEQKTERHKLLFNVCIYLTWLFDKRKIFTYNCWTTGANCGRWQIRKCAFSTKLEGGGSCGRAVTLLLCNWKRGCWSNSFISALAFFPGRAWDCYLHLPVTLFVFSLHVGCFTYIRYISVLFVMP